MRRYFLLYFAFLHWAIWGTAQSTDMKVWLNTGTDQQRVERLVDLGVERDVATSPIGTTRPVEWLSLGNNDAAVLFLRCELDSADLYLMSAVNKSWHVADRMEFDCHYDGTVSVETASVRNAKNLEIAVHHACDGHGTGFLQQNFKIIDAANGKLKPVLDTEEVVNASRVPVGSYELVQRSTFAVVPSAQSRSRVIEETRSVTRNGKLSVQRRYFHWSARTGRYVPSKFLAVVAQEKVK